MASRSRIPNEGHGRKARWGREPSIGAGILTAGEVAERLMAALLKSAESKDFVGSNPTLSATTARRHGVRYARWRLCSSLTHLQVRSLRCSDAAFVSTTLPARYVPT